MISSFRSAHAFSMTLTNIGIGRHLHLLIPQFQNQIMDLLVLRIKLLFQQTQLMLQLAFSQIQPRRLSRLLQHLRFRFQIIGILHFECIKLFVQFRQNKSTLHCGICTEFRGKKEISALFRRLPGSRTFRFHHHLHLCLSVILRRPDHDCVEQVLNGVVTGSILIFHLRESPL